MNKLNSDTIHTQAFNFLNVINVYGLSKLLFFDFENFKTIIETASYREFKIPKAKGGMRTIEAPNQDLLFLQKQLNGYLQAVYYTIKSPSAHGFIISVLGEQKTHSIISNAQQHVGKNHVLNIDLKNFFHSISATQVRALFQAAPFNFSHDLATCIALICCYNKRLPMGAVTSPVISNFYCIAIDEQLQVIASNKNITYTRYADDLTFSANHSIDKRTISDIKNVIVKNNFLINKRIFRLQSKYRQQTVTGIKVNAKTNVDRRYIRNIRAMLHDIELNGLQSATSKHYNIKQANEKTMHDFLLKLTGMINFIGQIRGKNDLIYNKLRQHIRAHTLVKE